MTMLITAAGFEAAGVRTIVSSAIEFRELVGTLAAPGWSQAIRDAGPSIVMVANETGRTIVALTTRFLIDGGPLDGSHSVFFAAPDATGRHERELDYGRASERGIRPGQQKMIGIDFAVPHRHGHDGSSEQDADFYDPQVRNWIKHRARQVSAGRSIHVTLDAVIFDDGELLGEDREGLATHFEALVHARQNVYCSVLRCIEMGDPAENVVARLWPSEKASSAETLTIEGHAMNDARHAASALLNRYGGALLAGVLRRAILPQPFVTQRSPVHE